MMLRTTLLILAAALSGCELVSSEDDLPIAPRALTEMEREVVAAQNRFGFDLFREAAATDGNVFLSPVSVSLALGMTANGASGATYDGMRTALRKDHLDATGVNEAYRDLTAMLTGMDPRVSVEIANSIWYRLGYPVLPSFLETNRTYFDAHVAELDFASPDAPATINGWVNDRTHGLIDQVVDRIDASVVMYLINAIYFKADWRYAFDPAETAEGPFHDVSGVEIGRVPLMRMEAELPALVTEQFAAVDLPYGDSLFSMTVLLPSEEADADDLIAALNDTTWTAWSAQFAPRPVTLRLPRFEIAYRTSLVDALTAMGMGSAFQPGTADFSRLVDGGGPWIDDVIHQSVLIVDEAGTEAAAVTTVIIVETSVGGPLEMTVDRPFVVLIRERVTGSILFLGRITDLP